jgi:predicted neuraminidase
MLSGTDTLSQLVGVMLMLAPSSSDNHVENFSQPLFIFENHEVCKENAKSINQQNIQTIAPDFAEGSEVITTVYAWCKPIWKDKPK